MDGITNPATWKCNWSPLVHPFPHHGPGLGRLETHPSDLLPPWNKSDVHFASAQKVVLWTRRDWLWMQLNSLLSLSATFCATLFCRVMSFFLILWRSLMSGSFSSSVAALPKLKTLAAVGGSCLLFGSWCALVCWSCNLQCQTSLSQNWQWWWSLWFALAVMILAVSSTNWYHTLCWLVADHLILCCWNTLPGAEEFYAWSFWALWGVSGPGSSCVSLELTSVHCVVLSYTMHFILV